MEKKRLKVCINASVLDEKPTGLGQFILNVTNYLVNRYKHEIDFTVYSPTKSQLQIPETLIRKISPLLQPSRFKLASFIRLYWNLFVYPIHGFKFDFALNLTPHGSIFLSNQLTIVHDLITLHYPEISKFQNYYYRILLGKLLRRSKCIITISHYTKNEMVNFYKIDPNNIKVIHNGYDETLFYPRMEQSAFLKKYELGTFLLAVGPTLAHKNFERLIMAYSEVRKNRISMDPLVIVGGFPDYLNKLKLIVKTLNLENDIRFIGYVDNQDLANFYSSAKALIYPSLMEGFGLPVLEAMASGCPVICSNTSSLPEVGGDAVLYFDPTDVHDIQLKIEQIYLDASLIDAMKAKNIKQVLKFSWQATADNIYKVVCANQTESNY